MTPPDIPTDVPRKTRRRLPPGLLRREDAARFCSVGASTWDRLTAAGRNPAPIRLGGSVGWSRRELSLWIDCGCPPRDEWEPIWTAALLARRAART